MKNILFILYIYFIILKIGFYEKKIKEKNSEFKSQRENNNFN